MAKKKPTARRDRGTGSVYWDKHGKRWAGEVRIDGKRHRVHAKTKTDVKAKLHAIAVKAEAGDLPRETITVAQAVEMFQTNRLPNMTRNGKPLAPSTVQAHEWAAGIITEHLGRKKLHALTVANVETMLGDLADGGMAKATLHKVRSKLGQVIDFARRRKYVSDNVARLAELPATARPTQTRSALMPDDARALLEQLRDERNGALFALSLLVGLRPGEASALYWDDLDLEADPPTVNVTRGLQRAPGGATVGDDLKTTGSKRTIEISTDLAGWLKTQRKRQLEERMAAPRWIDDRLVFTTPTGGLTDPAKVRRDLAAICERAGVPKTRPNELRHSCASLLSDEGVPNEAIADLLGHTTTRMVDATYRHRLRPVVSVAARPGWTESK